MASEYAVMAKVDPSGVVSGAAKVKQELTGIDTAAAATKAGINKAFDPSSFDRSIGGLTSKISSLESTLDKVVLSTGRLADSMGKVRPASEGAAKGQDAVSAAARRVLQAVDAEAAGMAKLNALLDDARLGHAAGAVSAENLARVQALVTNGVNRQTASLGQQRAGYQQLGFQVQDISQSLVLGISPATVFAQQAGQTASAIQLMTGKTTGFVGFLGGPYGAIMIAATSLLVGLGSQYIKLGNEVDNEVKKLKEDARESENTRLAHERFKHTVEGVHKAITDATEARKKSIEASRTEAEQANIAAKANLNEALSIRKKTEAKLRAAQLDAETATDSATNNLDAATNQRAADARLTTARKAYEQSVKDTAAAEAELSATRVDLAVELGKKLADPMKQINDLYDQQIAKVRAAAVANKALTNGVAAQVKAIEARRKAAVADQQQRDSEAKSREREEARGGLTGFISPIQGGRISSGYGPRTAPTPGASTFHAGVDYAAPKGTAVSATAAGTVIHSGKLGGLGNVVIVDHGGGTITQYAHLSRIVSARGQRVNQGEKIGEVGSTGVSTGNHLDYRVKVGGRYVNPLGGRFRVDETDAALKAERLQDTARREAEAAERRREQQRDFVTGIEDQAATRGQPRTLTVQAQIAKALADFQRKFDRAATPDEGKRITAALTDADAREIAQRFDEAYTQPLARLQALQGKTGLDRAVLNAQLAESAAIGRDLTPVEAERIEATILQSDELERQAGILEALAQPLADYAGRLTSLNQLLRAGKISQADYNAEIARLGQGARNVLSDMPGVDPKTGRAYEDIAAIDAESARDAEEQQALRSNREQLLQLGIDYDALEEAQRRQHNARLAEIDAARKDQQLASAGDIASSMLSITETTIGKNNALYKALFVTEKAVAVARAIVAIQTGVALAAANPFPYNLGAIASVVAATASIVSNITAVTAGFEAGGYTGDGARNKAAGTVHGQEFVVNAPAVARPGNRAVLEAMNAGSALDRRPAAMPAPAASRPMVKVYPPAGHEVETRDDGNGELEFFIRRVSTDQTRKTVNGDLRRQNSRMNKTLRSTTNLRPRRG